MKLKTYAKIAAIAALSIGFSTQVYASGSGGIDDNMLNELKRMLEQQQAQIDKQAAEIAALKEQLGSNTEALAIKADDADVEGLDNVVTSTFSNVNVSLYGQLNPAVLWADNGDSSKLYVADNTHSQSRFGLRGTVATKSGWNVGGRFEMGITGNGTNLVNNWYTQESSDDPFSLRWAEVSFAHDTYGKLSLGKGDAASNNTAEVDLSETNAAMQDKTLWAGSGSLWYDSNTDTLTDVEVKDYFNGYDGISRTDRVRYDTPDFGGFHLAGSYSSGDAFDGSAWYSREFSGTKVAAGFGLANTGDVMEAAEMLYTGSASILFPMGINATFSSGLMEKKDSDLEDATFWYGKLGYLTQFSDYATTAFSIDYGEAESIKFNNEKGQSWALAAVHNLKDWGTEFYAIYRMYMADGDIADYDDVNTFMTGARFKF